MIAAAVAVVVAAVAVVLDSRSQHQPEPPELRSRALPAEAFLDSIGVVTHLSYIDTAYGRQSERAGAAGRVGRAPHPRGRAAAHRAARRRAACRPRRRNQGDAWQSATRAATRAADLRRRRGRGRRIGGGRGPERARQRQRPRLGRASCAPTCRRWPTPRSGSRRAPTVIGPSFIDPNSRHPARPNCRGFSTAIRTPAADRPSPRSSWRERVARDRRRTAARCSPRPATTTP